MVAEPPIPAGVDSAHKPGSRRQGLLELVKRFASFTDVRGRGHMAAGESGAGRPQGALKAPAAWVTLSAMSPKRAAIATYA